MSVTSAAVPQQQTAVRASSLWLYAAGVFCVVFGVLMILQTQGAGDGTWLLYAESFRHGQRLYSDMHLSLQPLFVLENSAWMALAGDGWLIGRIPAVLHLLAFVLGLGLIVRNIAVSDRQRGAVLICAFFASISFEAYRFDDYHVVADCLQLYSIVLLLYLARGQTARLTLLVSGVLGVLSGLAITCRLNDGLALFLAVLISVPWLAKTRRIVSVMVLGAAAVLTVVVVVRLTGDSFNDYLTYSLFKAVGNKGGSGSLLHHPMALPLNSMVWIWSYMPDGVLAWFLITSVIWGVLIAPLRRPHGRREVLLAAIGALVLLVSFAHVLLLFFDPHVLWNASAVIVVFTYAIALWTAVRVIYPPLRGRGSWDPRQMLLIVPLGQLASGSMSSGGVHLSLYGPDAVALLLVAIAPPFEIRIPRFRDTLLAALAIVTVSTITVRIAQPYSWLTYREHPMFVGRTIYHHPDFGPMIIDRDLLGMIQPVCQKVRGAGGSDQELLSLPYSFANYFCVVPPWRGYVQTFYDTTTAQTMRELTQHLEQSPPKWIFYQRQLKTLALHERIYNHGNRLEHRKLDEMIQQRIATGDWKIVYTSAFGDSDRWDNHWFLIQTH